MKHGGIFFSFILFLGWFYYRLTSSEKCYIWVSDIWLPLKKYRELNRDVNFSLSSGYNRLTLSRNLQVWSCWSYLSIQSYNILKIFITIIKFTEAFQPFMRTVSLMIVFYKYKSRQNSHVRTWFLCYHFKH
jgi:hypothetical protein